MKYSLPASVVATPTNVDEIPNLKNVFHLPTLKVKLNQPTDQLT